jgi:hypothetical protein
LEQTPDNPRGFSVYKGKLSRLLSIFCSDLF